MGRLDETRRRRRLMALEGRSGRGIWIVEVESVKVTSKNK
jgi:hypothetical protein